MVIYQAKYVDNQSLALLRKIIT